MKNNQPDAFRGSLTRYTDVLTSLEIESILENLEQPPAIGIRHNPLKGEAQELVRELSLRYQWELSPIPFCDHGWTLQKADQLPGTTFEHRMGQIYIQDPASMLPVSLFDMNEPHPIILDMASSPGGKTTHLIDRTHDQGFIIANDASKSRISALRSVLSSWGGINQIITQFPGEAFGTWFPETFDCILLDAPCSMENLRPTLNHPMRETSQTERLRLQERQIQLLKSGLSALKIGGQLVYATCSLAPEEDEAVINALLNDFPGVFYIDDVSQKIKLSAPGLSRFGSEIYHPDLIHAVRIWPHRTGMSGFFCVLLTKITPLPLLRNPAPHRDFERTGLQSIKENLKEQVLAQLSEQFGLDLDLILEEFNLEIFQRNNQLFLIPRYYLKNFMTLPYEYIGMPLGRWLTDQLEPSHAFVSRFGHFFTQGKVILDEERVAQWIAGRDIRYPGFTQQFKGQHVLVTDTHGRNLGLGKILPKRLRNMLPR
ncbi:MAG: hypothetical protein U9R53_05015 [Chloroflexota bacterium]|nr:hypothetical protein [Chloroflexota bacterium]